MTNQVAKPKTIKQAFCTDVAGQRYVKVQSGDEFLVRWNHDTILRPDAPELTDALLADIGIGEKGTHEDLKCWAAVRNYCIQYIQGEAERGVPVTVGEMNTLASAFSKVYQAGRKEQFPLGHVVD